MKRPKAIMPDVGAHVPSVARWFLRHSDAGMAVAVAGMVAMMILPLPTWLLDILITANISISVLLLLAVLYVPEPLAIATFPTILLLTTLYRLALNVSSTRLILLQADAGYVIAAFGTFVVAGNYVVGGVIFLILTLIQFIVIARGSERVAEVAARFTLDAMPGKQMSIDADLKSGLVDAKEARRRRAALEREAQFYGAMDGSMRFVKGDAIAGIIITIINIVAGLIIGVTQMGMEVGEAARVFTLLTIGDGLVSQIPALVISTSAGFVITRVASEEPGTHLGMEVGRQLLAQPRALLIVSLLLVGLGLVPGMPLGPFLLLGAVVGFIGWSMHWKRKGKRFAEVLAAQGPWAGGVEPHVLAGKTEDERRGKGEGPAGLLCGVSIDLLPPLDDSRGCSEGSSFPAKVQEEISAVRERLFEELGLKLPPVHIRTDGKLPPGANFVISINEVPVYKGTACAGKLYVGLSARELRDAGVAAEGCTDPSRRFEGAWVDASERERITPFDPTPLEPAGFIARCLEWTVRRRGEELVGMQQVQELLDMLETTHPVLVRNAVPKPVELVLLTDVCKRLISEGISLRYMQQILETLLFWVPREKNPASLTELVRSALRSYISSMHARDGRMEVFILSPAVEEVIRSSIHKTDGGGFLAMAPEVSRSILEAVGREVTVYCGLNRRNAVVVTQAEARRHLKKLIEADYPFVSVLSYGEIEPHIILSPVGQITVR